jgi:hypothetical protein
MPAATCAPAHWHRPEPLLPAPSGRRRRECQQLGVSGPAPTSYARRRHHPFPARPRLQDSAPPRALPTVVVPCRRAPSPPPHLSLPRALPAAASSSQPPTSCAVTPASPSSPAPPAGPTLLGHRPSPCSCRQQLPRRPLSLLHAHVLPRRLQLRRRLRLGMDASPATVAPVLWHRQPFPCPRRPVHAAGVQQWVPRRSQPRVG